MMSDDWRSETQGNLSRSAIYNTIKLKCANDAASIHVLPLIDDAVYYAYQRTKTILRHMGEFTLHDGDHLFRVLSLMERLVPPEQLDNFSVPELMLLILTAFFHDIGMAPSEQDVLAWKKTWDEHPLLDNDHDKAQYESFLRFCKARPDKEQSINDYLKQGNLSGAQLIKDYLITDYIRITHADRSRQIIHDDWAEKIRYRDTDLAVEFSNICFSHNEDASGLLELDKNQLCGPGIYACLPLIAVILRLSDLLDFDAKRTPSILYSHLFVRDPISIKEWHKHRTIESWTINSNIIQFHAKCGHPAIESSIKEFCNIIDAELGICNQVLGVLNEFHATNGRKINLRLPLKMDRSKIETKKDFKNNPVYLYRETKFNLSKAQVIDLLMGTKLYGDASVALRELIQNSIDACLLRRAMESNWETNYTPEISIKLLVENGQEILEVKDNGTGMDQAIIDSYYSKVGSSFYKSTEFYDLRSETNSDFTPTSRFGIGILSCFMVSDVLVVETRRVYGPHDSSPPLNITIEGQESLFVIKSGTRATPGTTTRLILRKESHPWKKMTPAKFIESVKDVVRNPPFKISVESGDEYLAIDQNSFKEIKAESIKGNDWRSHENIRNFHIDLNDQEHGIAGTAIIAVVEQFGIPVNKIAVKTKDIQIDGVSFNLDKEIFLSGTEIRLMSSTISIDDNSEIKSSQVNALLARSKSRLSLHGIDIAATLFPEYWMRQQNQAALDWPMPMLIVIDVCGENDLDLNSARTQILPTPKWFSLEEKIARLIFKGIKDEVTPAYWTELRKVLTLTAKDDIFLATINAA